MAQPGAPSQTGSTFAAIAVGLIIFAFNVFDMLVLRRGSLISFQMMSVTFIAYVIFGLLARGVVNDQSREGWYWFIAMWLVPVILGLTAKLTGTVPFLGWLTITAAYFPLFLFYFYKHGVLTRMITAYFIVWLIGVALWAADDIKTYAADQGLEVGYNPFVSYEFMLKWTKEATSNLFTRVFVTAPASISEQVNVMLREAKGDYYTGTVDSAAQKRLGVYVEPLKLAEPKFFENTPVTAFTRMRAETLDRQLDITVTCDAVSQNPTTTMTAPVVGDLSVPIASEAETIPATKILPQNIFNVITSDQYDIDCIWNRGVLAKGSHTLKFRATFDFTTRAYKRVFVMDRDRLREYRRQNQDPLAGVANPNSPAIYTSGPVRVGMGVGEQQPLALGQRGETLQPWGLTIENAWEGKIVEITDVVIFVPEGLKVVDPGDEKIWTKIDCMLLPEEEQESCDDSLVEVYRMSSEELGKELYKNLTTKNLRVYVEVSDPDKVLGKAPIAVQNFKSSVRYHYALDRSTPALVREVSAQ